MIRCNSDLNDILPDVLFDLRKEYSATGVEYSNKIFIIRFSYSKAYNNDYVFCEILIDFNYWWQLIGYEYYSTEADLNLLICSTVRLLSKSFSNYLQCEYTDEKEQQERLKLTKYFPNINKYLIYL